MNLLRDREFQTQQLIKKWNSRDALRELDVLNKQNQLVLELIKNNLQTVKK